jgi:hypothetical protein
MTVVLDPSSRFTSVTVTSAFPVCDFVSVVSSAGDVGVVPEAAPESGKIMVVPDDGGSEVCAATGSADSTINPSSGTKRFMFNQLFGRPFVQVAGTGNLTAMVNRSFRRPEDATNFPIARTSVGGSLPSHAGSTPVSLDTGTRLTCAKNTLHAPVDTRQSCRFTVNTSNTAPGSMSKKCTLTAPQVRLHGRAVIQPQPGCKRE